MAEASADLSIRPLAPADQALRLALWRGYLAFYKAGAPLEVADLTFARLTDPAEPMEGALAFLGDKAVGWST